jgi:small nuclear ribonucleoprotein D2
MESEQPKKVPRTETKTKDILRTTVADGPFSVLDTAMKEKKRVFIQCRNSKALLAHVIAFDKHFNLVLKGVQEITESQGSEQKQRTIENLFLRGESVIFIVKLP